MTPERLNDIRGNIRIYDNRVAERDVSELLKEVARLQSENERLSFALNQANEAFSTSMGGSYSD